MEKGDSKRVKETTQLIICPKREPPFIKEREREREGGERGGERREGE